jgi:rhodanese-related sulfurtransferase
MKRKIKVALLGMLASAMGACAGTGDVTTVEADEFEKDITGHKVQLVDVRTPAEFSEGHLVNAVNIDVKEPDFISKASPRLDRKNKVYVYCRSGKRSMDAARQLSKSGYKVVNLSGGILEWEQQRKPIVR